MKTIYLVTGAAGFMGTNVCAQLLERGDAVRAFVLKGDPAVKFMPKAVEIFEGDLCSAEDCEKFFAVEPGTQTVCIHCASMVTINPNYSEKLIAVNVGGTENMLNAAKNHPECKKFVYVSSTGAIPELPKGESIHEVYSFVPYDDDRVVGWPQQGNGDPEGTGRRRGRAECLRGASQRYSWPKRPRHRADDPHADPDFER